MAKTINKTKKKTKIKALIPSLREKKRYVKFKIISKEKLVDSKLVYNKLKYGIMKYLGTYGFGRAGIMILQERYNTSEQTGIIKVGHKYVNDLKSALMFVQDIGENKPVIIKSLTTSGILKKAQRRM